MEPTKEEEREEGGQLESFFPPSWRVHHNFSDYGYSVHANVAVSKQEF
jgi:hypothetical protein